MPRFKLVIDDTLNLPAIGCCEVVSNLRFLSLMIP